MENIKVQADLNEVCCILKLLCNLNFLFLPVFLPALEQLKFCWKQKKLLERFLRLLFSGNCMFLCPFYHQHEEAELAP